MTFFCRRFSTLPPTRAGDRGGARELLHSSKPLIRRIFNSMAYTTCLMSTGQREYDQHENRRIRVRTSGGVRAGGDHLPRLLDSAEERRHMTAQIAILNKSAIALASDSAVTVTTRGNRKTYNTVNKLYTLSKYAPVGIMFYGNAEFMGTPWETIVKIYREALGAKRFNTIDEYAKDFLLHIEQATDIFPASLQRRHFEYRLASCLSALKSDLDKSVNDLFKAGENVTEAVIANQFQLILKAYAKHLRRLPRLPQCDRDYGRKLIAKHSKEIDKIAAEILEKLPRTQSDNARLRFMAKALITRADFGGPHSGIVIAGFGESEHFPKLRSFLIDGIVDGVLKYKQDKTADISHKNSAQISPFAQADMVQEFMEGVHPSFAEFFESRLSEMFRRMPDEILKCFGPTNEPTAKSCVGKMQAFFDKLLSDLNRDQHRFRRQYHINPVVDTVAVLPKDEIATMAEALVNLTQFRQKITLQTETVGGPIDVAVISKGDGFIWIQRKHYFEPKYNPYFFDNYFRQTQQEGGTPCLSEPRIRQ
jgi:hypothetical protein